MGRIRSRLLAIKRRRFSCKAKRKRSLKCRDSTNTQKAVDLPEDRELREVEKLLGMKGGRKSKLPSEFTRDGLDYVVNFLSESSEEEQMTNSSKETDEHLSARKDSCSGLMTRQEESSSHFKQRQVKKKVPRTVHFEEPRDLGIPASVSSYSIPQNRLQSVSDSTIVNKLRRTIQGLLNRLSEGNINNIVTQLEQLYFNHSRNDVNTVLTEIMMKCTIQPVLLGNKMSMEYMMVMALLHSKIGTEVGAFYIESLVKKFTQIRQSSDREGVSKELGCCVLSLAHLYSFKVVHCVLIYDVIRSLLESFTELDIELLVLLLKECGMEIRKDDPGSLKEIIMQAQAKSSSVEASSSSDNSCLSRVKFMFEIIAAIKTNNIHRIPNYDPELKLRMKKVLKALGKCFGTQVMDESNQLKLPLRDLLEVDTRGRWWIVGSSWNRGEGSESTRNELTCNAKSDSIESSEILELAKEQRMSTDHRKNLFCIIMSSEDYIDAFTKLIKLKLRSSQEREIIHVLLECCLQEKPFNLFYVHLGQKLCQYHRNHQVTFQYSIWDKLKSLNGLNEVQVANLCHFLIYMISNRSFSISILRIVEFSRLNRNEVVFYKTFFQNLFQRSNTDDIRDMFSRVHHSKKLLNDVSLFINQYVVTSSLFQEYLAIIEDYIK